MCQLNNSHSDAYGYPLALFPVHIRRPGDLVYIISSAEVSQFVALVVILQSRNPGSSWQKRNREVLLSGEAIITRVCSSAVAVRKRQTYLVALSRVSFLPLPPSPLPTPHLQDRDSLQQAGVPRVEPPDAQVGRAAGHSRAGS